MRRISTAVFGSFVLACFATAAAAAPRVPQIPVLGGGLQAFMDVVDPSIDVLTKQQDAQRWSFGGSNSLFRFEIELTGNAASNTFGMYDAASPAPQLRPVFPSTATTGWFAVVTFRTGPVRAEVIVFDDWANYLGTTTYPGVGKNDPLGFYLEGAAGALYTEDFRNPGGAAQGLLFGGTGRDFGAWWLCWEELTAAAGSDSDFDDAVMYLDFRVQLPVTRSSWGELKRRFR